MTPPRRLLVGVAHANEPNDARRYLIELVTGLATLGVRTQVALLNRGPARDDLEAVADLRLTPVPRPRTPAGIIESAARRVGHGLDQVVHDWRTRGRRGWIDAPDGIHLNSPQAAPLLRYVKSPEVPVTTYVHSEDFNITGLQPRDRDLLLARTVRFLVADQAAKQDLLANGVEASRIEIAPAAPLIFPAPPVTPSVRAEARAAIGLPPDAFVLGVPPVPDWVEAPDLTLALAWELQQRRPDAAPWILWYAMPADPERRWPIDYDIERMGVSNVRLTNVRLPDVLTGDPDPTIDEYDLADLMVLPSHGTAACDDRFVDRAAAHGTPVLCWNSHPLAPEVRSWTGSVIDQPDVAAMADRVLQLADDPGERSRLHRVGRQASLAPIARLVPLDMAVP